MRFGIVILPEHPWPRAREIWRRAEALGFDHAWTYDHLSWTSLADRPWGATIPTLTAAAVVTERIRLGPFVSNPNFRHPVPFAKDLATVDEVSGGRFTLGVGSGVGSGFDSFVLGDPEYPARRRHERFVEFVELLDALLRFEAPGDEGIDHEGPWYTARGARMAGLPAQEPRMPFAIAANGARGLELVARLGDGWITNGPSTTDDAAWWRRVAELARSLDETAARLGRDPATIDRYLSYDAVAVGGRFALSSVATFEDAACRAEELGFTDLVVHWPRPEGVYAGSEHVLDEVASRFDRHRIR